MTLRSFPFAQQLRRLGGAAAVLGLLAGAPHLGSGAGLLIADGGFGGRLEIQEQAVDVTINNGIAVTHVTQVFKNTENRQLEALYTFPVPRKASVSNFSMWIGGKEVIGEVLEKERAREIYNSYKEVRRDPGLLEQTDYRTFEMRVFPIAPLAEQKVQISYYQELDFDHDRATYVYPLAKVTRGEPSSTTAGNFAFTLRARSEVPIVGMTSPSHAEQMAVVRRTDQFYEASLEQKDGSLARDLVVAYDISRPRTGVDLITSKQPGEDGFFCLTITAGKELETTATPGTDYAFLLDVSGSMAFDGKLATSRDSLQSFFQTLEAGDRFEVMTFNVAPNLLFGKLTEVTSGTISRASDFLDSQGARGGTSLRPALEAAYRYAQSDRPLNLVVMSDGMSDQKERTELLRLIGQKPSGARIFCVGVGNEVDRQLLSQLAEEAGGLAAFLSQGDDFAGQSAAFRRKLMHPVATDLQVQIDGISVTELEPGGKLPNLFHGAPVRLYGRYSAGGKAQVTVKAEVDGRSVEQELELEFPAEDAANPEIDRMWAWHRIQSLQKEADRRGSRQDVVSKIVELGEEFSIVTEYTSFLVLENDAEYQRWKIERRNARRMGRDRAAQERLRGELDRLRDQSLAQIGPVENLKDVPLPAAPSQIASSLPEPATARQTVTQPPSGRNLHWFDRGGNTGRSGGGALDPGTALALAAAAFAAAARRR